MGSKITGALKDLAKTTAIGAAISAVITGIAALIGAFAGMAECLDAARRILFVMGALGLIVLAVAILARGKNPGFGDARDMAVWRKRFSVMHIPDVVGFTGAALIACGCMVDCVVRAIWG